MDRLTELLPGLNSAQEVKLNEAVRKFHHWPSSIGISHSDRLGYVQAHGVDRLSTLIDGWDQAGPTYPQDFNFEQKKAIEAQARFNQWNQPFGVERHVEECHRVAADPALLEAAVTHRVANEATVGGRR